MKRGWLWYIRAFRKYICKLYNTCHLPAKKTVHLLFSLSAAQGDKERASLSIPSLRQTCICHPPLRGFPSQQKNLSPLFILLYLFLQILIITSPFVSMLFSLHFSIQLQIPLIQPSLSSFFYVLMDTLVSLDDFTN